MPKTFKEWMLCALIAELLIIGGVLACLTVQYGPESVRAAKDTLVHGDGLVGEARLAAKNSVQASKDTDTAMQNLNGVVTKVGVLVIKFGATADAATGTISKAGKLVAHVDADVTKAEKPAAETKQKIDAAIDAYASVPPRLNAALEPLPAFEHSLTNTSDALGNFINGPLVATAAKNIGDLAGNSATMVGDFDRRFLAPYSGNHPKIHTTLAIGKGLLGLTEPGYYTKGILGK
jgi:ABC-type transporter Mla subunit MlaD